MLNMAIDRKHPTKFFTTKDTKKYFKQEFFVSFVVILFQYLKLLGTEGSRGL
jgi:hypothetical protein